MPVNEGNHPVLDGRCRSGYRPASCFTEAETNGKKDTADISGHGWDEHTVSAEVAVWPLAVGDRAKSAGGGPGLIPSTECGRRRPCRCSKARPPAGSGQRQLSNGWRSGTLAASAPRSCAPCNDDYRTGERSTVQTRKSTSPRSIPRAGRPRSTSPTATPWASPSAASPISTRCPGGQRDDGTEYRAYWQATWWSGWTLAGAPVGDLVGLAVPGDQRLALLITEDHQGLTPGGAVHPHSGDLTAPACRFCPEVSQAPAEVAALEEPFPDVLNTPLHLGLVLGVSHPGGVGDEPPVL